jgi:trimeric autotransporter adhesin
MVNAMRRSSVKRICGAAFSAIAAAALSSCTVGSPGPCNGCIDSASVAPGAISADALQNGAVDSNAIAAGSVTSAAIADGAVGTAQLASGAVTGANIAAGTITGANIDPTTTIDATAFTYATPVTRLAIADPTLCQRVGSNIAPYQDLGVMHPAPSGGGAVGPVGTAGGPSLVVATGAAGTYELYCPVQLDVPSGGTTRITSASMAFVDNSDQCLVAASLNVRDIWGASNNGTAVANVFSGTGAGDFTSKPGGPTSKGFTAAGLPYTVTALAQVFVTAVIQVNTALTNPPDCRYSGVVVAYTVDRL